MISDPDSRTTAPDADPQTITRASATFAGNRVSEPDTDRSLPAEGSNPVSVDYLRLAVRALALVSWCMLLGAFWHQRRLLRRLQKRQADDSGQLCELRGRLVEADHRHAAAVGELAQVHRAQDVALRRYLERSTLYINRLERHRSDLYRTAVSHGHERLLRELRSPSPVEQEYRTFFEEFDRSFLSLYPDFAAKANALLREQERLKTVDGALNTELRLLAAIRLGVTSSGEIARLLHISINTVYTYRNRLRNAAVCPPAEFEQRIAEIV